MLKILSAIIILFLFAQACVQSVVYDICRTGADEGYFVTLSNELKRRGIKHTLMKGKLCVKKENKEDYEQAALFVQSYRNGVATILKNKNIERKIVEWLTTENKLYQITETTNGERFLIIHSGSKEEEALNREKLSKIEVSR